MEEEEEGVQVKICRCHNAEQVKYLPRINI